MDYVKSLLQIFAERLPEYNEMDLTPFEQKYAHPLSFYLLKYTSELRKRRDSEKSGWLNTKNTFQPGVTNAQVMEKILAEFEAVDALLKNTVGRLKQGFRFSSQRQKVTFDTYDGAHTTYDVLDEYQYIQDIIYGKLAILS